MFIFEVQNVMIEADRVSPLPFPLGAGETAGRGERVCVESAAE